MGVSWCAFGPVGAMCYVGARVSRTAAAMCGMVADQPSLLLPVRTIPQSAVTQCCVVVRCIFVVAP